jgi:opacity protein-like surface antigen
MNQRKTLRANFVSKATVSACLLAASMNIYAASWDGMYMGAQFGKAKNRTDWQYNNANYFNTLGTVVQGNDFNVSVNGTLMGLEAGYNFQMASFILGAEGALLKTKLNTTNTSPFFATDTETTNIKRIGTVKGRIGYAYDSWLLSFNGGFATANVELTIQNQSNNVSANTTQWINGWTTGTAVEYKISDQFSVGVAYDYVKLSLHNKGLSCANCGTGTGLGSPVMDGTLKTKSVTTRINYFF